MRTPSTADDHITPDPKHDAEPVRPAARPSETHTVVKGKQAHRTPNERDESSDSGSAVPSELMHIAHDDAGSAKAETDKGEATDAVYRRTLRDNPPGAERDREPDDGR